MPLILVGVKIVYIKSILGELYSNIDWASLFREPQMLQSMKLFFGSTGVWTQGLTLGRQSFLLFEPLYQPFITLNFFKIGSHELFAWGWFWTIILLISAYWVARITSVSHQYLAQNMKCFEHLHDTTSGKFYTRPHVTGCGQNTVALRILYTVIFRWCVCGGGVDMRHRQISYLHLDPISKISHYVYANISKNLKSKTLLGPSILDKGDSASMRDVTVEDKIKCQSRVPNSEPGRSLWTGVIREGFMEEIGADL
jgi:hypothetical protein